MSNSTPLINPSNSLPSQPPQHQKPLLIKTLNVQGLNTHGKIESLYNDDYNIISCYTETKNSIAHLLPNKFKNRILINSKPSNSPKNGTMISIHKTLASHIFKTITNNEYWCSILLKFKPKIKLIITVVYLPHNLDERKTAYRSLKQHLSSITNSSHHIVTGDFNTYLINNPSIMSQQLAKNRKFILSSII